MAETSIEWADYTFNPWIGCTKVSAGCDHCYAEALDRRMAKVWGGTHWGPGVKRRLASDAYWATPHLWNRKRARLVEYAGRNPGSAHMLRPRPRVFCASMADVFDPEVPQEWRDRLWALVDRTPELDWLLLSKRPQFMERMMPMRWLGPNLAPKENVWLGTSVEAQNQIVRVKSLRRVPARVRFLSVEPMLEPVVPDLEGIDWVICGGESGPGARPFDYLWAGALLDHCRNRNVAFFMKQMGSNPLRHWQSKGKGGDLSEWPPPLRIREFPNEGGGRRHGGDGERPTEASG